MKKKLLLLILIMVIIIGGGMAITKGIEKKDNVNEDKIKVVTSFYPIYVAAANVVSDMDNIELVNLTENQTGCLHDYQLTTGDMKTLEDADVLVINGGGMESFIEEVVKSYPDITVIEASTGIPLLEGVEHDHDHDDAEDDHNDGVNDVDHDDAEDDHDDEVNDVDHEDETDEEHDHEDYNAHVWLNMNYYLTQIENIKDGLVEYDQENEKYYTNNAKVYEEKITELKEELESTLQNPLNTQVVIFHDAFAYLAQELGIEVVHAVEMDSDTSLSAGEIAEIIDEINEHNIHLLFTEEQYSDSIAASIADETNAKVYTIDSLVTGSLDKDAYIKGMKHNIEVLKEALYAK